MLTSSLIELSETAEMNGCRLDAPVEDRDLKAGNFTGKKW